VKILDSKEFRQGPDASVVYGVLAIDNAEEPSSLHYAR
jgi:hypothetical protein